ncbi:MAG: hypothetical protein KatS3mg108_2759 [Isosphaeraceae bacterium]|nr:MAG: hypothetical protein KatS3mg108_2759 [Isosphaeraceae bacterium]
MDEDGEAEGGDRTEQGGCGAEGDGAAVGACQAIDANSGQGGGGDGDPKVIAGGHAAGAEDGDVGDDVEKDRETPQHQEEAEDGQNQPGADPAIAPGGGSEGGQGQADDAEEGVHLEVGVEAVHPVGVAGAGAVGLADQKGGEEFGMPGAVGDFVPGQAASAGGAVDQLLGGKPLDGRDQDGEQAHQGGGGEGGEPALPGVFEGGAVEGVDAQSQAGDEGILEVAGKDLAGQGD